MDQTDLRIFLKETRKIQLRCTEYHISLAVSYF